MARQIIETVRKHDSCISIKDHEKALDNSLKYQLKLSDAINKQEAQHKEAVREVLDRILYFCQGATEDEIYNKVLSLKAEYK